MLGSTGAKKGNPKFKDVKIVDDRPDIESGGEPKQCTPGKTAVTIHGWKIGFGAFYPSEIILCPQFFLFGTIDGGPGREWPGKPTRTCDNVGTSVSRLMWTLSHFVVHEYTHLEEIMQPVLGQATKDHVYDFYQSRNLDKALATKNADSYANFATELMWSSKCDRDFAAPGPDNKHPLARPVADPASQDVPPAAASSSASARASS